MTGCDFCGPGLSAVVSYPCEDFTHLVMGTHPRSMTGSWAACATCRDLVESEQWEELTGQAFRAHEKLRRWRHPQHLRERLVADTRALHEGFRQHRTGPAEVIPESGNAWDSLLDEGRDVLVVTPEIRENDPPEVKEGLARRALVNAGGTCPCGARMILPSRAERRRAQREHRALRITIEHESDCPAVTKNLTAALRRRPR